MPLTERPHTVPAFLHGKIDYFTIWTRAGKLFSFIPRLNYLLRCSKGLPMNGQTEAQPDLDVLIIGGGPQGVWVLNRLKEEGYCCQLWESSQLGAGQSAHAEWYLHRGYTFRNRPPWINQLAPSSEQWQSRIQGMLAVPDPISPAKSYIGFNGTIPPPGAIEQWRTLDLAVTHVDPMPAPLDSTRITCLYATSEICIDPSPTMKGLAHHYQSDIVSITGDLQVTCSGDRIEKVSTTRADSATSYQVRPCAVILTSGAGNSDVLEATFGVAPIGTTMQTERHGTLLVLKDEADHLQDFNAFIWETGLFIVSRKTDDCRIWLVSSHDTWKETDPPFDAAETKERIANLWELLAIEFAMVERSRHQLSYAVSAGTLISNNFAENIENVHTWESPGPINLIAVWPQRLTLAPHWADEVVQRLGQLGCRPRCQALPCGGSAVGHAPPKWDSDWMDYTDFERSYLS